MNVAVILAGGNGLRMGGDMPKQFMKIDGKYMLQYSIEAFSQNKNIDEIAIVVNPNYLKQAEDIIFSNDYDKVRMIIKGGRERYDSTYHAVMTYSNMNRNKYNILFHDAARPFVSQRIIDDVVEALKTFRAVAVALSATETIVRVEDAKVSSVPDRRLLYRAQTPQGFDINVIKKAYEIAFNDPDFYASDDCGIVSKYLPDIPIGVVAGEEQNVKITYESDLK